MSEFILMPVELWLTGLIACVVVWLLFERRRPL